MIRTAYTLDGQVTLAAGETKTLALTAPDGLAFAYDRVILHSTGDLADLVLSADAQLVSSKTRNELPEAHGDAYAEQFRYSRLAAPYYLQARESVIFTFTNNGADAVTVYVGLPGERGAGADALVERLAAEYGRLRPVLTSAVLVVAAGAQNKRTALATPRTPYFFRRAFLGGNADGVRVALRENERLILPALPKELYALSYAAHQEAQPIEPDPRQRLYAEASSSAGAARTVSVLVEAYERA